MSIVKMRQESRKGVFLQLEALRGGRKDEQTYDNDNDCGVG